MRAVVVVWRLLMAKVDWSDGGKPSPEMSRIRKSDITHENKIKRLTLAKYKAICQANTGHPFCDGVLRQIKNRGFVSKKQASILFEIDSKQRKQNGD